MRKICEKSFHESYCPKRLNLEKLFLTHENCIFVKKDNLAYKTISSNDVNFASHNACKECKRPFEQGASFSTLGHVEHAFQGPLSKVELHVWFSTYKACRKSLVDG